MHIQRIPISGLNSIILGGGWQSLGKNKMKARYEGDRLH